MDKREQEEHYKRILTDVLDLLEGGDVALDFEDMPSAATTIRIIADIAGKAKTNLVATRELMDALKRKVDVTIKRREEEDKEVSK